MPNKRLVGNKFYSHIKKSSFDVMFLMFHSIIFSLKLYIQGIKAHYEYAF